MQLNCPECGKPQYCPCKSCVKRHGRQIVWVDFDDDTIACGYCGMRMHYSVWELEESKQYDEYKKAKGESDDTSIDIKW